MFTGEEEDRRKAVLGQRTAWAIGDTEIGTRSGVLYNKSLKYDIGFEIDLVTWSVFSNDC